MPTASDFTVENCATVGQGDLVLSGPLASFASFADANTSGLVWYSIEDGFNREAGIGTYDGDKTIVRSTIHSTLYAGNFNNGSPDPIDLSGSSIVSCTINKTLFESMEAQIAQLAEDIANASAGVPAGGTEGQILVKQSDTDGDAIWEDNSSSGGGGVTYSGYCPGYAVVAGMFPNLLEIADINATNLFYIGRTLAMLDIDGNEEKVTVTDVEYATNKTSITVDPAPLTQWVDVCFTSSVVGWSPISSDPFMGSSINAIAFGMVGAQKTWVAVGDGGKVFISTTAGDTWTPATSGTTENLNAVSFSPLTDEFLIVGNLNTAILMATDGTISAMPVNAQAIGDWDLMSCTWAPDGSAWIVLQTRISDSITYTYSILSGGPVWFTGAGFTNIYGKKRITFKQKSTDEEYHTCMGRYVTWLSPYTDTSETGYYTAPSDVMLRDIAPTDFDAYNTIVVGGTSLDGLIAFLDNASVRYTDTTAKPLSAIAISGTHSRAVAVGDEGFICSVESSDFGASLTHTSRPNGLDPLANFNDVCWGHEDGIFIAVASNGQILRSSNGLT